MQLLQEDIQTEAEFKAACQANGADAVKILNYIKSQLKELVFTPDKLKDFAPLVHKVRALDEVIQVIKDSNVNIPTLNY